MLNIDNLQLECCQESKAGKKIAVIYAEQLHQIAFHQKIGGPGSPRIREEWASLKKYIPKIKSVKKYIDTVLELSQEWRYCNCVVTIVIYN